MRRCKSLDEVEKEGPHVILRGGPNSGVGNRIQQRLKFLFLVCPKSDLRGLENRCKESRVILQ